MIPLGRPYRVLQEFGMMAWCENNLVIPIETQTPWPGPYTTNNTPWVRGWYDIIEDPETRLLAIMKGAQVAATQTFMGSAFYWTCEDPGAVLYVMDSTDVVRETSKLRLIPTIKASPTVAHELHQEEQDSTTNLLYRFRRCFWRLVGANSLGKISSFTQRYAIIEEPEKYREALGKEGSPIEAILQRLKRIEESKALIGCTPAPSAGSSPSMPGSGICACTTCPAPIARRAWCSVFQMSLARTSLRTGSRLHT